MTPPPSGCPICGKPSCGGKLSPFCGVRCAEVDLGRWFGETYRVPAGPADVVPAQDDEE